jgi:hypothetical protein
MLMMKNKLRLKKLDKVMSWKRASEEIIIKTKPIK